ncbi:hypothetical protein DICA0_A08812 [Diutina catenulata]
MSELRVLEVVYPYVDTRTQLKLLSLLKKPRYEQVAQRLRNIPIAVTAHNVDIAPRDAVNILDHHHLQGNKVAFYSNEDQLRYFDDPRIAETVKVVYLGDTYEMPKLPHITKLRMKYLSYDTFVDLSSYTNLEELSIDRMCLLQELVVPASLRRLRASYLLGPLKWPYTLPPTHLRLERGNVENLNEFLEHAWPTLEVFETNQVCQLTSPTNKPIALRRLKMPKPPGRFSRYKTPRLESIHLTAFTPRDVYLLNSQQVRWLDGITMDKLPIDLEQLPTLALATVNFEQPIETSTLEQWLAKYAPHLTRLKANINGESFKFPHSLTHLDLTRTMFESSQRFDLRGDNLQFLKLTKHYGDLHVDCPNLKEAHFNGCDFKQQDLCCPTLTRAKFYNSTGVSLDTLPKSIRHLEFNRSRVTASNTWHFTGDSLKIKEGADFPCSIVDASDVHLDGGERTGWRYNYPIILSSDSVFAKFLVIGAKNVVLKRFSLPIRLPDNVRSVTLDDCSVPVTYLFELDHLKSLDFHDVRYEGVFHLPSSLERFSWQDGEATQIDYAPATQLKELCTPAFKYDDCVPAMPIALLSKMKSLRHFMAGSRYERRAESRYEQKSIADFDRQWFAKIRGSKSSNLSMAWLSYRSMDMVDKEVPADTIHSYNQPPGEEKGADMDKSNKRQGKRNSRSRKRAKKH